MAATIPARTRRASLAERIERDIMTRQSAMIALKISRLSGRGVIFVCWTYVRRSSENLRRWSRKSLISLCGDNLRRRMRRCCGDAEKLLQAIEISPDFNAEQILRRRGDVPYKRGGLLRCLPASPLSFEDSKNWSASIVCLSGGHRLGIRFAERCSMPDWTSRSIAIGLPHQRISARAA